MKVLLYGLISLVACAALPHQEASSVASSETGLGQMIAHGGLVFSEEAKQQSDSAYQWSWANRKETAMCVPRGAYAFGVALNGKPFVLVLGFVAANTKSSDSVNVFWDGSICGDSLPSYHTHLIENGMRWQPSPCDMHQAALRPQVPFHIVASDTGKLTAYRANPDFATKAVPWCGPHSR